MTAPTRSGNFAIRLPDKLAVLYQPLKPLLNKIHIRRAGPRGYNPQDILLPAGYRAELVADGLNAPVHVTFDDRTGAFVSESGHKIDSPPRIVRIDLINGAREVVYEVPPEEWVKSGALTGAAWVTGYIYFTMTDTLYRLSPSGRVDAIVTGLPGRGDHQTNHPVVGPDQKIYWGQGCATNAGVVGPDDYAFEWLTKFPDACDVPGGDIELVGRNFEMPDLLGSVRDSVETGAYSPFGHPTAPGQVIPGQVKASGAVLRCGTNGDELELVAWGLRNPYGLAFHPDGRLFATEHGMDERGVRYIVGDPDDLYEIRLGEWYGWPDFASGIRMDDPHWGEAGLNREPLLARFPNPEPPKPLASFETHTAANGMAICDKLAFGFHGQAFVAMFGDLVPITTLHYAAKPAGFKVARVDLETGAVYDFAVNRIAGPASKLPHEGFERPSHAAFGPDGALYVVDYGEIEIAPEKGGIRSQMGTGSLWRIVRDEGPQGQVPPEPAEPPLYALQGAGILLGLAAVVAGVAFLVRWMRRRG